MTCYTRAREKRAPSTWHDRNGTDGVLAGQPCRGEERVGAVEPAMTVLPGAFSTGQDLPVILDLSTVLFPVTGYNFAVDNGA